jgi:hypothetical protein
LLISLSDLSGQQSTVQSAANSRTQFQVQSQQPSVEQSVDYLYHTFDRLYGMDQNLVNGIRYKVEHPGSEGHPFLEDETISPGSIRMNNKQYDHARLGYNIYNQSVILEYTNFAGAPEQIVLHNEFIEAFELYQKKFRKMTFEESGTAFFQVIDEQDIQCLYLWSKSLNRSTTSVSNFYIYSDPKRKFYLLKSGQLHEFRSKKGFVNLFGEEHRKQIKKYFRDRHLQLKYISDNHMQELLNFCIGLSED